MKSYEAAYQSLFAELKNYEKSGVSMLMDGYRASPIQIVEAHLTKEEGTYMRDYIMDPEGYIKTLTFNKIKKNHRQ